MAFPDKPPIRLLKIGIIVSMSMLIALKVLIAVMIFAPASIATLASSTTSIEPTPTFTDIGLLVFILTVFTILFTASGSSPTSIPILDT